MFATTSMPVRQVQRLPALFLGVLFATNALAQYVWKDERGVRQYSDRPPPSSVPNSRIIKAPGFMPSDAAAAPADAATDATTVDKEDGKPVTLAERNADYQKRRAEQQEKENKRTEEAKKAADKLRACDNAKSYQRALDSGERISRLGANGEREFLNDSQRAREIQSNRRVLENCK